ncbi:MAG: fatty acid desaturase family protein [Burkholderiales bacterium]
MTIGVSAAPPELIAPARLARIMRYALCDWAAIAAIVCTLWLGPAWLYPLGALVLAGRFHALGVVLHDACHMSPRPRGSQRWLLDVVAGYPIATNVDAMRFHHLRHHRASGTPQDPYFKPGVSHDALQRQLARLRAVLLVPAWIVRGFFGSVALHVPALQDSYARILMQDRSGRPMRGNSELLQCLRQEPKQALFFVGIGVLAWYYPTPVAAYYLAPLVLAGVLNVNRVVVEHVHVPCTDQRPETVAATTVTHDWGALGKLVLFPRNIGFHTVHHLHPRAALECLPALDRHYRAFMQRSAPLSPSGKKSSN